MHILVVHPGHAYSTADVFDGLVFGLRATGASVSTFPLMDEVLLAHTLIDAARAANALPTYPDPFAYACRSIPALAMAKGADAVIVVTGSNVPAAIPLTLRRGGIQTAILCTETPYLTHTREANDASFYDVVFTMERNGPPLFIHNDPATVSYLPHAYHPERHTPGPINPAKAPDVFFVGTRYPERAALFDAVFAACAHEIDWHEISQWYQPGDDPATAFRGVLPNTEAVAWYRSARISLQHHRTIADWTQGTQIAPQSAASLGPRVYEIAACGGFCLCDSTRPELADVFGACVPTYDPARPADLERQIRHYLAHPDQRDALAAQQQQAVQPHTWTARGLQIRTTLDGLRHRRGPLVAVPASPSHKELPWQP
jgi:hypothetical protein